MSKHTPGPWNCEGGHGNTSVVIEGPNGEVLGNVRAFIPSGEIRHGSPMMMPWAEGMTNARLIAAAPELLAALQGMVYYYGSVSADVDELFKASAAIAKATGAA